MNTQQTNETQKKTIVDEINELEKRYIENEMQSNELTRQQLETLKKLTIQQKAFFQNVISNLQKQIEQLKKPMEKTEVIETPHPIHRCSNVI